MEPPGCYSSRRAAAPSVGDIIARRPDPPDADILLGVNGVNQSPRSMPDGSGCVTSPPMETLGPRIAGAVLTVNHPRSRHCPTTLHILVPASSVQNRGMWVICRWFEDHYGVVPFLVMCQDWTEFKRRCKEADNVRPEGHVPAAFMTQDQFIHLFSDDTNGRNQGQGWSPAIEEEESVPPAGRG